MSRRPRRHPPPPEGAPAIPRATTAAALAALLLSTAASTPLARDVEVLPELPSTRALASELGVEVGSRHRPTPHEDGTFDLRGFQELVDAVGHAAPDTLRRPTDVALLLLGLDSGRVQESHRTHIEVTERPSWGPAGTHTVTVARTRLQDDSVGGVRHVLRVTGAPGRWTVLDVRHDFSCRTGRGRWWWGTGGCL